ncbi:MAG: cytochrome-c peroxidase [Cyanothece sp. SIO1E1]|nr:cytochrome-c peroxidase [Cyanothece sp. SIO1E1]
MIPGILFCLVVFFLWGVSHWQEQPSVASYKSQLVATVNEPIQPIPLKIELDQAKVELGQKLFHDPQLSYDNSISCASCHNLATGGTDRLKTSIGVMGEAVAVNSPTVFNSGFNSKQFWNGRADTLEDQVDGPVLTAEEMGSHDWPSVINKLKQSSEYTTAFKQMYAEGITSDNIKDAIATFERSLYTPNAPFDQYLRGDQEALTADEKEGYRLFKSYGCISCHQGMLVGGNMFQTFGTMGDYFGDRGEVTEADLGRFNVTGNERDRFVFKVPSLRNVLLTSPYFHDGSAETLDQAIKLMGQYQLGINLPQEDVDQIMFFLNSLTGEYNGEPL